ncbi:MAG: serine/threonine-protein kinase [Pirellulaceae bacterium]|nr:serine/threonine-protein kinase [Pirellulaceae bacterium]
MPDLADPVIDLLVEWETQRQQGRLLTAAELCPHDVPLQAKLAERIARREKVLPIFEAPTLTEAELPAAAPHLPRVTGYEILEVLGRGGMGVVFKARQLGLNRLVALKMILSGANASPQELARFRTEAEAVAQLQHPGIVQIYEIGEQDRCPFLALEYVGGGSLAEQLDGTPVAARTAAELVLALARAVQHAHEKGIVHRDLKPANVLLTGDGPPKITDFGLAKRSGSDLAHTQTGAVLGSPSYMSPEQASGQSEDVGPATDIHALGVMLYELLTGRPPFKGATLLETIEQVRTHSAVPPRCLQPKIPRDLETICLKCLEKEPTRRYATASDLASDLANFLAGEPITAQSLTILDQVARGISHQSFDRRFRAFANTMTWISPLPLAVHLVAYALFWGRPIFPVAIVTTTALVVFLATGTLMLLSLATLRTVPSHQRRHFLTVWVSHLLALIVSLLAVVMFVPLDEPERLLMIYPIWVGIAAHSFFAHAAEAGIFYVVGSLMFALAVLMLFTPLFAPLEVSLFMTCNMIAQSIYLRRGGEADAPVRAPPGTGTSTVKG